MNSLLQFILGVLLFVLAVAWYLGCGYYCWEWLNPNSFWGYFKFVIIWHIKASLGYLILQFLVIIGAGLLSLVNRLFKK